VPVQATAVRSQRESYSPITRFVHTTLSALHSALSSRSRFPTLTQRRRKIRALLVSDRNHQIQGCSLKTVIIVTTLPDKDESILNRAALDGVLV